MNVARCNAQNCSKRTTAGGCAGERRAFADE